MRANIVPNHSAFSEWCNGGVRYVDCDETPFTTPAGQNTFQSLPNKQSFITALEELYQSRKQRVSIARAGYNLVTQEKYQWKNIAQQFHNVFVGMKNETNS